MRVGGERSRDRQSQLCNRNCGGAVVVVPWWGCAVLRCAVLRCAVAITACLCEASMHYLFTSSGYVRGSRASRNKLLEVIGKCRYLVCGLFNALVVYAMLPGCLFMLECLHYRHTAKSKQRRPLFA